MKGIQVLMLIALFAISTCINEYNGYAFTDKKLKEMKQIEEELLARDKEDERLSILAKEYLDSFDDDTENITNDPRIQIIVDAKKALKQIDLDLTREMEAYKRFYLYEKSRSARDLGSNYVTEEQEEYYPIKIKVQYELRIKDAIKEAKIKSIKPLVKVYNALLK